MHAKGPKGNLPKFKVNNVDRSKAKAPQQSHRKGGGMKVIADSHRKK